MARYFKLKLGSIWLTDSGLSSGNPCRVSLDGWSEFLLDKTGNMKRAASGKPRFNVLSFAKKGIVLTVTAEQMTETVYDSLQTLLNNALNTQTGFACEIVGAPLDATFNAMTMPGGGISAEDFIDTYIRRVRLQIVTI